jgi:hypothetical protein
VTGDADWNVVNFVIPNTLRKEEVAMIDESVKMEKEYFG